MSDIDSDLPDYLVEAILSEGPPADAVDLVKAAFTWRTVDAELMDLSYDSVLDEVGVRDASARRTMEFTIDELNLVLEVDGRRIEGSLSPVQDGMASILAQDLEAIVSSEIDAGRFTLTVAHAGPVRVQLQLGDGVVHVPIFAVA